ncbi:MAG: VOC family protein [Candidatus Bathyarchaeota archaeon]|nr:VOC family protein [Candidatus Bathyarchaeota archaeon]
MEKKIGLITILTNDIAPMRHFYSKVLGFNIIEDLGNYVEFKNEGVRFAICTREVMHEHTSHHSYTETRSGQSFELAFPVGSPHEVDRAYSLVVEMGATPIKAPEMMPWGRKTAFIADPEGNIHEIYSEKIEN